MTIIRRIEQWVCLHPRGQQIKRVSGSRLYLECSLCGHESKGVTYGKQEGAGVRLLQHT